MARNLLYFKPRWSKYELDSIDYEIFLTLQQEPLMSQRAMSKFLDMDPQTISKRLQLMKNKGFFRQNTEIDDSILGKREISETSAIYLPNKLNLLRQNVIFQSISSPGKLQILETMCDIFPYTHYKSVVYGEGRSLFVQFDIPPDIEESMKQIYKFVTDKDLCDSIITLDTISVSESQINLYQWQIGKDRWNLLDTQKSKTSTRSHRIDILWQLFLEDDQIERSYSLSLPDDNFKFDQFDLTLIRELTLNSKVSYKYLGDYYNKDKSTISKRMKKIRSEVAPYDYLHYDKSIFDLSYAQLITGNFRTNDAFNMRSFSSFLRSGYIPFSTTGIMDNDRFMWYMNIPPSFAPDLTDFAITRAENVKIHQINVITASTYYFNVNNFASKGKWNISKDYVLNGPITSISNILEKTSSFL